MCSDDERNIRVTENLAQRDIKTLVLGLALGLPPEDPCIGGDFCSIGGQACENGICTNQMPRVLDAMAIAGRTSIGGRHLQVTELNQLRQSLASITGNAVSCRYDLEGLMYDPNTIEVLVDGAAVARDEGRMAGWDTVDGALEFFGVNCDQLRDGMAHSIVATCAE